MKKYIYGLLTSLLIVSCGNEVSNEVIQSNTTQENNSIISVSSSIIPLSSVINIVGGEHVTVNNIIPAGVSPHGFDMSARDLVALEDSQIVFMTGLEHIDGFLEKAADADKQVHLADGIELLEVAAHDHNEHEDEHDDDHSEDEHHDDHENEHHEDDDEHGEDNHEEEGHEGHNDHSSDPHVWLGKENIMIIADKIRDQLTQIFPEQADYFAENTQRFSTDLEAAYTEFKGNIDGKTPKEFIVFHDAYNYLFESISLDSNLKIPFSENVLHESGTAHFAEIIDEIELHDIKYIFSEPQFSDTSLQKFADQYNLNVAELDPIGTDDSAAGYIDNLKNNLSALQSIYE